MLKTDFKREDIHSEQLAGEIVVFAIQQRDLSKTIIFSGSVPGNVPKKPKMPLKSSHKTEKVPDSYPVSDFQGQLLTLIKENPHITYNELSLKTKRDRKTVGRHLKTLKEKGFLHREGPAKGGHWKVSKP